MISFDGKESFEGLTLIKRGKAGQLETRFAGLLRFEFEDGGVVVMNRISSVHYFIEFFSTKYNYPYPKAVSFEAGLYECTGSSYLHRLQNNEYTSPAVKKGKHYVYWDNNFLWNILCESITVFEGRHEMDDNYL